MRFYSTKYELQDPSNLSKSIVYHSCIYASSYGNACKLAVMRGIGELVVGAIESADYNPCPLPSRMYEERKMMDCLHTLTFYCWIGTCAKVISSEFVLSDVGIIHEIMHEIHHPRFYSYRESIQKRIVDLEKMIPGLKTYVFPKNVKNHVEAVS